MSDLLHLNRARDGHGASALLLTFAGLTAAFGVAACCALPLILAALGLGAAWLGGLALLAAPHRSLLIAAAAACLIGAAALLWRQQRAQACRAGAVCSRPVLRGVTLVGLAAGVALLCLGLAYA